MKTYDPTLMNQLNEEGILKMPMLSDEQTKAIFSIYNEEILPALGSNPFYWSISDEDKARTKLINKKLKEIVLAYLLEHFADIRPIVSSFIVKAPGSESLVAHQDWSFVDHEPENNSFTCWIPLIDINEDNGILGFFPKSQNLYLGHRASPSPQYPRLFPENENTFSKLQYMTLRAGEPVVFNHRIIHASKPNVSNQFRPAIILAFTATESKLVHYFLKPNASNKTLQKYAVDEAFFDKYSNNELSQLFKQGLNIPDYSVIEELPNLTLC